MIHRAFVEVNEEGTEGAAAMPVEMEKCAEFIAPAPPPVFRADHPFLRDRHTGLVTPGAFHRLDRPARATMER